MDIHYINLQRRTDRDAAFRRVNAHLQNLHRVDAADGETLDRDLLIRERVMDGALPAFSAGSLGNALSHKLIWEQCIRNETGGTIAEDDAVFSFQFENKAPEVLAALPADWDIILWGWNFDSPLHFEIIEGLKQSIMLFDDAVMGARTPQFQAAQYSVMPMRLLSAFGTVAYSASRKGFQLLLKNCFPLRHELIVNPALNAQVWNCALDATLNKFYPRLKAYAAVPPLVWTENDKTGSDVFGISGQKG